MRSAIHPRAPIDLLDPLPPRGDDPEAQRREVKERVRRIDETLANFNLEGRVVASVYEDASGCKTRDMSVERASRLESDAEEKPRRQRP